MAVNYEYYVVAKTVFGKKVTQENPLLSDSSLLSSLDVSADLEDSSDSTFKFQPSPNPDPPPRPEEDTARVSIFVAIRLEDTIYKSAGLLRILGMRTLQEVKALRDNTTILSISNYSDAARLAVFDQYKMTLVAKDGNRVYGPYGKKHNTSFVMAFNVKRIDVVEALEQYTFLLTDQKYEYYVEKGSIKPKKEKKSAAKLTS